MATSKDVAKLAGVSHTTVSRAFRGDVKLRPETYDRVMQAAAQLHYTPNFLASSLKKRQSGVIGLVICDAGNPFFLGIAQRLEAMLDRRGYRLMVAFDGYNPEKQHRMLQMMAASQAQAIIYMPLAESLPLQFDSSIHFIQLFGKQDSRLSYLDFDDYYGAYTGMKYLLEMGHRRILVLGGENRRQGFLDACAEAGAEPPQFYSSPGLTEEQVASDLNAYLNQGELTALFAVGDWHGRHIYRAMKNNCIHFPEDLSFLMFDDLQWTQMLDITVIAHPVDELVDALCGEVLRLVEDEGEPSSRMFKPYLIERSSVRRVSTEK